MKVSGRNTGAGSTRLIIGLMVLLVFAIAGFIAVLVITSAENEFDKQYVRHAGELRVLSLEIVKDANEAALGKAEAFTRLQKSTDEYQRRWNYLRWGDSNTGLPGSPVQMEGDISLVQGAWEQTHLSVNQILESRESVLTLHQIAKTLYKAVPQLQIEYESVVAMLLQSKLPADQITTAQRQVWLAERIARHVSIVLEGGRNAVLAANDFELDASELSRIHQAMLHGDPTLNIRRINNTDVLKTLEKITEQFQIIYDSQDQIIESAPELLQVRVAANAISSNSKELLTKISVLVEHFQELPNNRSVQAWMGFVCNIVALVIVALLGMIIYRTTRARLREQSEANARNQGAILRLLDEIGDLADGDLTASATVTEDFTGAIADSINFSIDQLRGLVIAINQNSKQVLEAVQDARMTALNLSNASTSQSKQITEATDSINQIANSMDTVSGRADKSVKVADRSVVIANKGAGAVQNTINGMDSIREQIQKTSKQIKRLGESSQEIGDIVSLINDIANQTNILSLNAAIQASMAGDAGRGFAVVADEVQRLAERSGAATKQIEVLVKTIQADTKDAVISMEQTTAEVVQGARLAQDAGLALGEIEEVSNDLAKLIQQISGAAGTQSEAASQISSRMNIIQELTSQATAGTTATTASISKIADMSSEMSHAVAGFKLPGSKLEPVAINKGATTEDGEAIETASKNVYLQSDDVDENTDESSSLTVSEEGNDRQVQSVSVA